MNIKESLRVHTFFYFLLHDFGHICITDCANQDLTLRNIDEKYDLTNFIGLWVSDNLDKLIRKLKSTSNF